MSPPGRALFFTDAAATAVFPIDWTEQQIRNALEQAVQLQESEMYFGNPRLNAEYFARRIEGDDSVGFHRSPEEASPLFVRDDNSNKSDTTTQGGAAGPGMKHTLLGEWPIAGKFVYWPMTTPDGTVEIYRRNLENNTDDESFLGGPFKLSDSKTVWYDQGANSFRVWSTSRQKAELGSYNVSSRGGAGDGAMGVSSETWEGGGRQRAVLTPTRGPDEEVSGVGAESWVGKKSNSTGYKITSDRNHPGRAVGRAGAALAAARANGLARINAMNAKLWARG